MCTDSPPSPGPVEKALSEGSGCLGPQDATCRTGGRKQVKGCWGGGQGGAWLRRPPGTFQGD